MRLTILFALSGLAAIAFAVVSLGSRSASADTVTIETGNYYFCTAADQGHVCASSVDVGDTVTWQGVGGVHRVEQCTDDTFTSCGISASLFDLQQFGPGDTRSQTFNTAGDIYYRCQFHPDLMRGEIEVEAAATDTPTAAPTGSRTAAVSATATPKAVPQTGGPNDGGTNAWDYALLLVGGALVAGSASAFVLARRR
jgi:hypothetical protein